MTNPIEEILKDIAGHVVEQDNNQEYTVQPGEHLKLIKLYGLFMVKNEFHVGDLVGWKPGLKNKNTPVGKALIVTKVCEKPITCQDDDTGSAYFCEQLDITCAQLTSGAFLEFYFDSRRLQPYEPERQDND